MITLVLLPGMDGTGDLFQDFTNALNQAQKTQVIRYPADRPLSYSALENFVEQSIASLGPYVLLGESFSGPIAASLASKKDTQLKGLILCCSFIENPRPGLSKLSALINVLPIKLAPMKVLASLLCGRFSTHHLSSKLKKAIANSPPSVLRHRLTSVLNVNYTEKLASISVPILYLRASEDSVVPKVASEIIAEIKPSVQIVEITGPHFLLQASPNEAAIAVNSFLSKVRASL